MMSRGGDYPGVQHFAQPTGKPCGDCGERQSEYIVPGVALWVCESCLMKYLPETPERKRIVKLLEDNRQLDQCREMLLRTQGQLMLLSRKLDELERWARRHGGLFPDGLEYQPVERWLIAIEHALDNLE
jgi:hypothetical protein